jgi:hypothetical protein
MPKVATLLLVAFSLLPAEPADSLLSQMTVAQDSTAQAPADSLVPTTSEPQTSQADPRLREDDIPRASSLEPRTSNPDSGGVAGVSPAEGVAEDCGAGCSEGETSPS